jgi:hypothetical protein
MKLAAWPGRRPRLSGVNLADALEHEFGEEWGASLPQRLLEAVWDGDLRSLDSDARRLAKILPLAGPPNQHLRVQVEFLTALYAAGLRWARLSPGADPHSDALRYGEVAALMRSRSLLQARAAAAPDLPGQPDPLSGRWVEGAADLVVRAVRFRDGFAMPELVRVLEAAGHRARRDGEVLRSFEQYLASLATVGSRVVNGVPDGTSGADCMRRIRQRFGGEQPYATAVRAAMKAIRDGDGETLRELADLTAAAASDERSPARVLHNLVLAGEKVLYDRA